MNLRLRKRRIVIRCRARLDQSPARCMHNRLQTAMRAKLLVGVMKMVAQSSDRNAQFLCRRARAFAFREQTEDPFLLLAQRRNWRQRTILLRQDRYLLRQFYYPASQMFHFFAAADVPDEMDDKLPPCTVVVIKKNGDVDPHPVTRTFLYFHVVVGNFPAGEHTLADRACLTADQSAQRPATLKEWAAGLVQDFVGRISKQLFCRVVPGSDKSLSINGEYSVGCVLQESKQFCFQHETPVMIVTSIESNERLIAGGCLTYTRQEDIKVGW